MSVLESHSVRRTDGSFSESLYGLRRRPVKVSVKRSSPGTESSDKVYDSALRKRQKILSVVFLVVSHIVSQSCSLYTTKKGKPGCRQLFGGRMMFDLMKLALY
uniref:PEX12 n=1 Tax=Arundo donax TaxID=35708 RepID=A0A0A9DUR6_ARUDO